MIDSLYNSTRKGWLKAFSFIISTVMFISILLFSERFSTHFGGQTPYLVLLVLYGMTILWIHGIGFEIRLHLFKAVFLPIIGYIIVLPSLCYLIFPLFI
ncbi:cyd operon YbgE family protein [Otariodibacter oris]|uniref:Cyd operon protein YbgE n=1 Tax=Otariodibacter oris TaxID=1032623 RepID=A0A420XHN6_9PAST|nr:cyd operon YbgE family protein [Otariodibacter oris]QGM81288.1 cytochrome bd biosynthesis protein [Otariodibacter oris]RKR72852.1 cyd operon protein YbgE [Otariodibacter oris]